MRITEGNIASIVDFDYQDYLLWLDPDEKSQSIWHGTCLQFSGEEGKTFAIISLITYFQDLMSFLQIDHWVMKHEDMDFPWIPEEDLENEFLVPFKKLLADNHISSQHSGALLLNEKELKSIVAEMLYYPMNLSYKNIDFMLHESYCISNTERAKAYIFIVISSYLSEPLYHKKHAHNFHKYFFLHALLFSIQQP